MKIVVIGGGSTGLVYGAKLSDVADTTILVRRSEQADAINSSGITLERPDGPEHFSATATIDVRVLGDADLSIGLTKCYDATGIAQTVAQRSKKDLALLCLHNGLGAIEIYNQTLGSDRVIGGVTYLGANRLSDTTAKLGVGVRTVIAEQSGEITQRLTDIADVLSRANFQTETTDSVDHLIWDKLILSIGQHALCAITGLSFKEMRDSPETLAISEKLMQETHAITNAEGLGFTDKDFMPRVVKNLEFGADHYSSMYQDVKAGRPTEVDYINGAISQLGKKHSIPTPVNDSIVEQIHAMRSNS